VNSFIRGAVTPLLSFWRLSCLLLAGGVLVGCSSHRHALPPFTASGYIDEGGAVRIWRKDSENGSVHLLSVFSPWHNGNTAVNDYRWQGDKLVSMVLKTEGDAPQTITVRFDANGALSFMQREVNGMKQQLSNEQIALEQYNATRIRKTSDALRTGKVVLHQGHWNQNESITTCEGHVSHPEFDSFFLSYIQDRQRRSAKPVSVAWLSAPEGTQLLLVANSDFCSWQPKADTF
jgi:hypothetical protein